MRNSGMASRYDSWVLDMDVGMTPDLDAIRARHVWGHARYPDTVGRCVCGEVWPCDTATVLVALDQATRQRDTLLANGPDLRVWLDYKTERNAALAREKALAEALTLCSDRLVHVHGESPNVDYILTSRRALAAHEEATR